MDVTDRRRGVLVGLALGDALGAPVEFDDPQMISDHRDELFTLPGGGYFCWAPGEFTDDTQMALVLGRHLTRNRGEVDRDQLALDFAAWLRGAKDVGEQTRKVLLAVARGEDWSAASGRLPPDSEGNGSLMRTAPVALVGEREGVLTLAATQSSVTHPSKKCLEACAAYAWILRGAIDSGKVYLDGAMVRVSDPRVQEAIARSKATTAPIMSGWVLATLTGALWAVQHAQDFQDAIWRAVSLGHDADTVGAVAGALAGARWGLSGIPSELSRQLQSKHPAFEGRYPDDLIALADDLSALV